MKMTGKLTAAALAVLVMAGAAPAAGNFRILPDMAIHASALSGSGTASDPYVVATWNDLNNCMHMGGYIKLGADVTDPTKDSNSYLSTLFDRTVVLDLNGHTIDRGLTAAIDRGWVIYNVGTLTIKDSMGGGKITGGTVWNSSCCCC